MLCFAVQGLTGSRISLTLGLEWTNRGDERYSTMTAMREEVAAIIPSAFPYSFQFLYWEEVGVIDVELARNLLICGSVIIVMVSLMIPAPRVACAVILVIIMSIIDVVGAWPPDKC